MKRNRWWIPLAAIVLLAIGGYFMSQGDAPEPPRAIEKVKFPTRYNRHDWDRAQARRTLAMKTVAEAKAAATDPDDVEVRPRDPLLTALPSKEQGKTEVVFEANALRNSPLGELLLDCLRHDEHGRDPFAKFKAKAKFDPLTDLDRVALAGDDVVLTGNFKNADWRTAFEGDLDERYPVEGYGDHATVYHLHDWYEVAWGDSMLIGGKNLDSITAMVDRLEGRVPAGPPSIPEDETYGEVYGFIAPSELSKLAGSSDEELFKKLAAVAENIKVHVDAQNDVAIVADISGPDADKVTDFAKTLGGVLGLGRIKAQAEGNDKLAELLDLAEVDPRGDSFQAKLALPMPFLEKTLARCREHADAGSAP